MHHNKRLGSSGEPHNDPARGSNQVNNRPRQQQNGRSRSRQQRRNQNRQQVSTAKQDSFKPSDDRRQQPQQQQPRVTYTANSDFINHDKFDNDSHLTTNVAHTQVMQQQAQINCLNFVSPPHLQINQQQQHQQQQPCNQPDYTSIYANQVSDEQGPITYLPPNYTLNHFNLEPELANAYASQNHARQRLLLEEVHQYLSQAIDYHYYTRGDLPTVYYCPTQSNQQQQQQTAPFLVSRQLDFGPCGVVVGSQTINQHHDIQDTSSLATGSLEMLNAEFGGLGPI